jgi:SAM-dependent methyltransferase
VSIACRAWGARGQLAPILSLGRTPLANALLTAERLAEPEPTYPLDLVFCPACSLVQITETVPPERLFRDYPYSSFSDTMVLSAKELIERPSPNASSDRARWSSRSRATTATCSSTIAISACRSSASSRPRTSPASPRRAASLTLCDFWRALAEAPAADGRLADVLHANHVLAHVAELGGVVRGIRRILQPGGLAVVEVPYVRDLIDQREFDTIYHEHLCYSSLTALDRLVGAHGLVVSDVERLGLHGGSLRVSVGHPGSPRSERVRELLSDERAIGMLDTAYYRDFAGRVDALRAELLALLRELKARGKRLAAYGASAKGSTLLNTFGIGAEILDFVVDRSSVKQGRYTPGTHLPILPPAALLERRPDYVLLLTWNFAEEILVQQAPYRAQGGRFIVPVPEPRVV